MFLNKVLVWVFGLELIEGPPGHRANSLPLYSSGRKLSDMLQILTQIQLFCLNIWQIILRVCVSKGFAHREIDFLLKDPVGQHVFEYTASPPIVRCPKTFCAVQTNAKLNMQINCV